MIGKTFDTIVPSSGEGWDAIATRASLIAGLSDSYESERVSKGGERKRVRVQISPVRDPSGAIVGVSTVERDIDSGLVDEELLALPTATTSQIVSLLASHHV